MPRVQALELKASLVTVLHVASPKVQHEVLAAGLPIGRRRAAQGVQQGERLPQAQHEGLPQACQQHGRLSSWVRTG
eukprot:1154335-Pelagomonas_calceolata.AAC.2